MHAKKISRVRHGHATMNAVLIAAAVLAIGSADGLLKTQTGLAVPIVTEAAMRDLQGEPIRDCLMPHIAHFNNGTFYAYGFGIPANATGDQRIATCYTSTDLAGWTKRACSIPDVQVCACVCACVCARACVCL